uniref:Uncharacterized protein n=1 Tax=Hyaloperonospora arabidopsidis (strain Emoy2) TaxID=559515 RepID=M4BS67_HYAAE
MEEAVNYVCSLTVTMRMRHWRRIQHPVRIMQSSRTRSMNSKSWPFSEKKALGAMRKWSRPLRTSVTMCTLHSVWRNVYVKRLAKRWQHRPLVLELLLPRKWQVAGHFVRGETTDEEADAFVRWVQRTRRRSSMYVLRASVSVADVRLERKLRYDYAKLKARGQWCNRTRYGSVTTVAASAG